MKPMKLFGGITAYNTEDEKEGEENGKWNKSCAVRMVDIN